MKKNKEVKVETFTGEAQAFDPLTGARLGERQKISVQVRPLSPAEQAVADGRGEDKKEKIVFV